MIIIISRSNITDHKSSAQKRKKKLTNSMPIMVLKHA